MKIWLILDQYSRDHKNESQSDTENPVFDLKVVYKAF